MESFRTACKQSFVGIEFHYRISLSVLKKLTLLDKTKSVDLDNLHTWFLHELKNEIAWTMSSIF